MTPSEFKAWFDGFTEAFSGVPTKAQWARIKARVSEIDGNPVTERIFVDRYWPYYTGPYYPYISRTFTVGGVVGGGFSNSVGQNSNSEWKAPDNTAFSSTDAMYALGKADAASFTAG